MQVALVLVFASTVLGYGPPRPSSSNNGCGGGGGSCGGGQVSLPAQSSPCSGNSCGSGGGSFVSIASSPGSSSGGSGDYWWAGNESPFSGPPAQHVSITGSTSSGRPHPVRPAAQQQIAFVQRPHPQSQQNLPTPIQSVSFQQVPSTQNIVQSPMGICPASYVCVHWQLCRDGYVITDGSGNIDKRIKDIPAQIASRYESCGGDMVCCGVPAGSRPIVSQPLIPAPSPTPTRPAIQTAVITAPAPQQVRPVQPARPIQPAGPVSQPVRPVQSARPVIQPVRPVQPARPASQQSISLPARPSTGYGNPQVPASSLIPHTPALPNNQPNPQSSILRPLPPQPQPRPPVSNPVGLVSPPNPQPMPMGMMGMMGMPMRGGSCSAGTYCVPPDQCNPYTGFIIRNPSQLMAVWPDAPTVPLLPCFVPDGSIQNGVCCQEAHPNAGGFD
ncbi:hypothetical protein SK128_028130 [Halocaridina rubra]|uniref:PPAF-2-like Clip domain-containing protein n=1 Tax=Halocaridina rubra TaxID=373956 RepID=A0AAN8WPJ9_HALRR